MSFAAVASLSFSSLAFELLVTRCFSLAHGSALTFLAIGVAMFGFAVGGTVHALGAGPVPRAVRSEEARFFRRLCGGGSLATIGAFLAVKGLPLDYMKLPVQPAQGAYVLLSWLALALPFFFAGLASCAAYALHPDRSGTISFASLLGSALGALSPILLLPLLGEGGAVVAAAAVPLGSIIAFPGGVAARAAAAVAAAVELTLAAVAGAPLLAIEASPYKALPQLEQAPGTMVARGSPGIRGRIEQVESPALHFAPGLSLAFRGTLPSQEALFTDGDSITVFYRMDRPGSEEFARWTHTYALLIAADRARQCLVIQADGGLALACALAGRRARVTLVIEDPRIAAQAARHYAGAGVVVAAESPRAYAARSGRRFDAVAVEAWGPTLHGMASLEVSSLLTRDALRSYWRLLSADGVLAISRRLVLPPSDALRVLATCVEALAREGVSEPLRHVVVVRSWDGCTLLVSRRGFDVPDAARLEDFAASRGFDVDRFPEVSTGDSARFNTYDAPAFSETYRQLIKDPGFVSAYPLDVQPQGDDRPFPSHFIRWTRIGEFARLTGQRAYTLFLSGEVTAGSTLLIALVTGLGLVGAALTQVRRNRDVLPGVGGAFILLSSAAGAGFMLAEMFVVDSVGAVLPSPSVALSVALAGLLVSSSLGGLLSERLAPGSLRLLLPGLAVALAVLAFALPGVVRQALLLPGARIAACIAMAAAPGVLIGIPFPAVLRISGRTARLRACGWAANGCASAVASVSAALIAPAIGIRALLLLAAAAYAGAGLLLRARSLRFP